jgi:hypothetical protein
MSSDYVWPDVLFRLAGVLYVLLRRMSTDYVWPDVYVEEGHTIHRPSEIGHRVKLNPRTYVEEGHTIHRPNEIGHRVKRNPRTYVEEGHTIHRPDYAWPDVLFRLAGVLYVLLRRMSSDYVWPDVLFRLAGVLYVLLRRMSSDYVTKYLNSTFNKNPVVILLDWPCFYATKPHIPVIWVRTKLSLEYMTRTSRKIFHRSVLLCCSLCIEGTKTGF